MNILKRCLSVVVVLGMALALLKGLNFFTMQDPWTFCELTLEEFYQQDDIDILLVGPSGVVSGIDSAIVEEKTGLKTISVATDGQLLDASFALIKEAVQRYSLKHIYLELSDGVAGATSSPQQRTDDLMAQTYMVADYLRPSWNKLQFLLQASGPDRYLESFFLPHGEMSVLFDPERVAEVCRRKMSAEYKAHKNVLSANGEVKYAGKGFRQYFNVCERYASQWAYRPFDPDRVSEFWKETLAQIIAFCREQGVELTLFAHPTTDFKLLCQGNYDEFTAMVQALIAGTGVEFVNFSLLKESYYPRLMSDFYDYNHMNMYGAQRFSAIFADFINGALPANAFAGSIAERLDALPPAFYGIAWPPDSLPGETRLYRMVAAHPDELEYRVTYRQTGTEPILVQDFSASTEFLIPAPEGKTLRIEWKRQGAPAENAEVEEYEL